MSWLEAFGIARIIRLEYEQMRKHLRANLTDPPLHPHPAGMCRRCGCDLNTCREFGCLDQGEPMGPERLTGRNDAASCVTHYTDRMRG